jgi:plasmid stability protein
MSTLTIRKLDEEVKQGLRIRAARNNASMEAEARAILEAAVRKPQAPQRAEAIRRVRGQWKGRTTTDAMMAITRGD